jgi:hypothetical protein
MHARLRLGWPNAFSAIVLLILVCIYLMQPSDLDYCWQIRTGERILETGRVLQPDAFSYTIAGKDLPDHEWLYEVLLALVWRGLGDPGMKLMRVVLFAAPIAVLAWQLRSRGVRLHVVALAVIGCAFVICDFERLRPMVCSTVGLQLVAGWLHDHCHGRRKLDWRLPLTMLLWSNLHPAVIMGQALLAGAIAWEWFSYWRWQSHVSIPRGLTLWGGLGLLATLIAPDPVGRLLYPFAPELRHPAQRLFQEIRPPWHYLGTPPFVFDFALLLAVVYAAVLVLRRREFRGWEWCLLLGVAGLAATAARGVVDWLLITTAFVLPQLGPALRDLNLRRSRVGRFVLRIDRVVKKIMHGPVLRPQAGWPLVFVAVMALVSLYPIGPRLPGRENQRWPTEAVDWIAVNGLPSQGPWKVFSGSDEGTYLFWRLHDRVRVYSDTRGFYYPGDLLLDSYYLPGADAEWPQRLERALGYGSEYFLLPIGVELWQLFEPHVPQPLYRDDKYVLLSRDQVTRAAAKVGYAPKPPATEMVKRH